MQALILSIPPISSLLVIVLLTQFIFGIIAVNLFKSKSFECDTSLMNLSAHEIQYLIKNKADCMNYGGEWERNFHNYDYILGSMWEMMVMS